MTADTKTEKPISREEAIQRLDEFADFLFNDRKDGIKSLRNNLERLRDFARAEWMRRGLLELYCIYVLGQKPQEIHEVPAPLAELMPGHTVGHFFIDTMHMAEEGSLLAEVLLQNGSRRMAIMRGLNERNFVYGHTFEFNPETQQWQDHGGNHDLDLGELTHLLVD